MIQNERDIRQKKNNADAYDAILSGSVSRIKAVANYKAFMRYVEEINIGVEQLLEEAATSKILAKVLAMAIAKNASRQGALDEKSQLDQIRDQCHCLGISIVKLKTHIRGHLASGNIIAGPVSTMSEYTKSFDGAIVVNKNTIGYVFAKVVRGCGGHQDNVFKEASEFLKWVNEKAAPDIFYSVIMDVCDRNVDRVASLVKICSVDNIYAGSSAGFVDAITEYLENEKISRMIYELESVSLIK